MWLWRILLARRRGRGFFCWGGGEGEVEALADTALFYIGTLGWDAQIGEIATKV